MPDAAAAPPAPVPPATPEAKAAPQAAAPPVVDLALAQKKAQEAEQIRLRGIAIRKQREESEQKTKAEIETLRADADRAKKALADHEAWRKKAVQDPDAALREVYGEKWYEALTKAKLGDDSNLQVKALRDEFEAKFKAEQDIRQQQAEEQRKKLEAEAASATEAEKKAVQDFHASCADYAKTHADEFPTLNAIGAHVNVGPEAQALYEAGKPSTEADAAKSVEAKLDATIEKVLGTPKWLEKIKAMVGSTVGGKRKEEAPEFKVTPRRSIGNDLTPAPAKAAGPLTREQRRDLAVQKLERGEYK